MSFKKIIQHVPGTKASGILEDFKKEEFIYPISKNNLSPILVLIKNCMLQGNDTGTNVEIVSVNPSIWLGEFLDKHIDNISYVCASPVFNILKYDEVDIYSKSYRCDRIVFYDDNSADDFFNSNKWKSLVIYSIVKNVDLKNMKSWYTLRYADITETYEIRDNKINEILDGTNNN
jgi:hypothetical protein